MQNKNTETTKNSRTRGMPNTQEENMRGEIRRPSAKVSLETALEIYAIKILQERAGCTPRRGMPATSVAKRYGTSEKILRDIWSGRTWRRETAMLLEPPEAADILCRMRPRGRPRNQIETKASRPQKQFGREVNSSKEMEVSPVLHQFSEDGEDRCTSDPFHFDWPYWI
mmetsp:Transcript_28133/g.74262  ORF Transcript_28133/g.74262 Transcript_28133/m.74262 type:complete len:169 (-) Transcript_28133:429-935(-)